MTTAMADPRESVKREPSADVVSPELVLVDPELARAARSRLPDAAATITHTYRDPDAAAARLSFSVSTHDDLVRLGEAQTSRRLLVGVAAVTMLALLLFDVRVEVGELPASAEPEALQSPSPESPAGPLRPNQPHTATAPSSRSAPAPTGRRFAWAPTTGASGYYVEFFREGTRVYARQTIRPALEIPARWRHEGVERSFRPGKYSWYVWPVVGGQRLTRAAVQTTVSIPSG